MIKSNTTYRSAVTAILALGVVAVSTSQASAISSSVRNACMGDYLSYCSQHGTNASKVGRCMRRNGTRLSKRCVKALVNAGYVSKSEVSRRSASLGPK